MEEPLPPLTPTPADAPSAAAPTPTPAPTTMQAEPIEGEPIEGEGPIFSDQGEMMGVPDGVDPLYLDGGSELGHCPECGDAICGVRGCGFGSKPIFEARVEYLLWQMEGMPIPALVIRGTPNNNGTPTNRDDDFLDDAFVVYGNQRILEDDRSGVRVRLAYWLDDCGQLAIDGEYINLGEVEEHFIDGGDGTFPIVGRPFVDDTTGLDDFEQVSFPGLEGAVTVDSDSQFQSAALHIRRNLCCVPGCQTCCGDAVTCGSGVGCGSCCGGGCPCPLLGGVVRQILARRDAARRSAVRRPLGGIAGGPTHPRRSRAD